MTDLESEFEELNEFMEMLESETSATVLEIVREEGPQNWEIRFWDDNQEEEVIVDVDGDDVGAYSQVFQMGDARL